MNKVDIYIDNEKLSVPSDTTVMQAAEQIGIKIPRLCYHPDLSIEVIKGLIQPGGGQHLVGGIFREEILPDGIHSYIF